MNSEREKPWHKNAANLLVVNSILAAIAAIVVAPAFATDAYATKWLWVAFGLIAMFLFVLSAEKITEAFNADSVRMYVAYYLPYNIGVLFLVGSVMGMVRHYAGISSCGSLVMFTVGVVAWAWGWGCDTWFIVHGSAADLIEHFDELEGRRDPEKCIDWFTQLLLRLRPGLAEKQEDAGTAHAPHANVYCRLRPSTRHGVGVFAIVPIKKGTKLFPDDCEEIRWVDGSTVKDLPIEVRRLYDDFAIIKDGKYGCPSSFNKLTVSWYFNDSDTPNVSVDRNYDMAALMDIAAGEELTIDSSKFSEQPYKNGK